MSDPEYSRNTGPVFRQPEGVNPYVEEQTIPFVDLYSQSDDGGGTSPHQRGDDHWGPGAGDSRPDGSAQFPPQYAANPQDHSAPPQQQPTSSVPQQSQPWGYVPYMPVEHPQATTVLVLGLVSFAVPVTSFIAWYMGNKAKGEIERGAPFPYSGSLKIGHVIGKVMGILTIVGIAVSVVIMTFYVILMVGLLANS